MPQSFSKILIHTVFSTKNRRPLLHDQSLREELHCYIGGILTNHDCQSILVGGVEDHIHTLSTLSRTMAVAALVKEVKRGSSVWLKTKSAGLADFAWQNGYGVFSIGFSQLASGTILPRRTSTTAKYPSKTSFENYSRDTESTSMNDTSGIDDAPLNRQRVGCNPSRVASSCRAFEPRVARSSQPWAK